MMCMSSTRSCCVIARGKAADSSPTVRHPQQQQQVAAAVVLRIAYSEDNVHQVTLSFVQNDESLFVNRFR